MTYGMSTDNATSEFHPFNDSVSEKDNIQYHLLVTTFCLRSKLKWMMSQIIATENNFK